MACHGPCEGACHQNTSAALSPITEKALVSVSPAGRVLCFGPLPQLLGLQIYHSHAGSCDRGTCVCVCVCVLESASGITFIINTVTLFSKQCSSWALFMKTTLLGLAFFPIISVFNRSPQDSPPVPTRGWAWEAISMRDSTDPGWGIVIGPSEGSWVAAPLGCL